MNQVAPQALILPAELSPDERPAALALVRQCPPQAQALLDELSGRLRKHSVRVSAIAYLRGMVRRALAGSFVPELAGGVAAARRLSTQFTKAGKQDKADAGHPLAETWTPEVEQNIADRKARVRQLLDAMRARAGSRPAR